MVGHVETGGGSGSGAELFGPDSLVTLDVVFIGIAMEVWRKRNIPVIGDDIGKFARGGDGGGAIAENFFNGDSVGGFGVVGDIFNGEDVAIVEFAAIHNVVNFACMFLEDNQFAWATVGEFGENARAHDASVVQNN